MGLHEDFSGHTIAAIDEGLRLVEASAGALSSQALACRYQSLIRVAEVIRSQRDQRDLFQLLARELPLVVQFDVMCQFDDATNRISWHFGEPNDEANFIGAWDLPKEATIAWWVHRHQQSVVIRSVDEETRFPAVIERLKRLGVRSLCALPLSTVHRQLGGLIFASYIADAYSAEELRFLSVVAGQIALAMDDALNFQRLKLLLDLTNRLVSKLDLRELLREVSASIRQMMQCDSVSVALRDPETGQLHLYALDFPGSKSGIREGVEILTQDVPSLDLVLRTGHTVNATRPEIESNRFAAAEGTNSLCHLPLIGRERILGALTLSSTRDSAFSEGDVVFLGQVANQIALAVENAIAYGQIAQFKDKLAQENVYLEAEIRTELHFDDIVGNSVALRRVLAEIETVAPTDSTVLIYGETGTGKELIARAVHNVSSRKSHSFVKLNCAAIPTGLLESELFGHEKGAFTGAIAQRVGRFELAHRGTIFLDEVGEIPLELQPKLLRVLQEREFERLGSTRTLHTDARLIAATNRDLEAMVAEHKFRSDLFYRLNVFPVRVPALRERPEDIPLLVRHFVQQFSRRNNRAISTIPSETMEVLVGYHWPGNIRELQNVIERAVIISKGPVLSVPVADLKTHGITEANPSTLQPALNEDLRGVLEKAERAEILRALEQAKGVIAGPNGAAARLGLKRSTFQVRMHKLGIRLSRMAVDAAG